MFAMIFTHSKRDTKLFLDFEAAKKFAEKKGEPATIKSPNDNLICSYFGPKHGWMMVH